MKLIINSQISTVVPLKFRNGLVISSHSITEVELYQRGAVDQPHMNTTTWLVNNRADQLVEKSTLFSPLWMRSMVFALCCYNVHEHLGYLDAKTAIATTVPFLHEYGW